MLFIKHCPWRNKGHSPQKVHKVLYDSHDLQSETFSRLLSGTCLDCKDTQLNLFMTLVFENEMALEHCARCVWMTLISQRMARKKNKTILIWNINLQWQFFRNHHPSFLASYEFSCLYSDSLDKAWGFIMQEAAKLYYSGPEYTGFGVVMTSLC